MNEGLKFQKTVKVGEIQTGRGFDLVVILDRTASQYPLKLYKKFYDGGWRRKKVNEFDNLVTTMQYMTAIIAGQIPV